MIIIIIFIERTQLAKVVSFRVLKHVNLYSGKLLFYNCMLRAMVSQAEVTTDLS